MTLAAVCVSLRRVSEAAPDNIELRSFNCIYLISGSGSSSFDNKLEMFCAVRFRAMLKVL